MRYIVPSLENRPFSIHNFVLPGLIIIKLGVIDYVGDPYFPAYKTAIIHHLSDL